MPANAAPRKLKPRFRAVSTRARKVAQPKANFISYSTNSDRIPPQCWTSIGPLSDNCERQSGGRGSGVWGVKTSVYVAKVNSEQDAVPVRLRIAEIALDAGLDTVRRETF